MKNYEDCIVFLLAKAYQKAHGSFKKRLFPFGLTPIQHLILEALWDEDGQSAGDIGKKLVLDGATLSGVLDRLATGGWVVKETDDEDKRILRIHLTKKGLDLTRLTAGATVTDCMFMGHRTQRIEGHPGGRLPGGWTGQQVTAQSIYDINQAL